MADDSEEKTGTWQRLLDRTVGAGTTTRAGRFSIYTSDGRRWLLVGILLALIAIVAFFGGLA